jgi:hypothetical protein
MKLRDKKMNSYVQLGTSFWVKCLKEECNYCYVLSPFQKLEIPQDSARISICVLVRFGRSLYRAYNFVSKSVYVFYT